jgi:transposase-like protein
MKDAVVMSKDNLKAYRLALKVIDGQLKVKDFALLNGLSERQAYRKLKRIREMDYLGALHGNTGMVPLNKTPSDLELTIVELLKTKYQGFNLTHFRESILENEKIEIKKTTLEKIARRHSLEKFPRRSNKRVHKPRPRMPQEGMLVQYDGSPHIWFGEESSVLLAAIDDATGKILAARFVEGETSLEGMRIIHEIIEKNGIPEAFYMDQAGIYGKLDRDQTSQIARALQTLHCRLHIASSPQAKGKVERLFRTLQDRLVSELKLRGIWDYTGANEYLQEFIHAFNRRFGVPAINPTTAYLPNVFGDLDLVFCRKEQRKIMNGNYFSYEGKHWLITENHNYNHRLVNINTHLDRSRSFDIMGKVVRVEKITRKSYLKTGT